MSEIPFCFSLGEYLLKWAVKRDISSSLAWRDSVALLGPFVKASVGFLNASDTYVDLHDNESDMQWIHDRALGGRRFQQQWIGNHSERECFIHYHWRRS